MDDEYPSNQKAKKKEENVNLTSLQVKQYEVWIVGGCLKR
jgi:hypothetical protein